MCNNMTSAMSNHGNKACLARVQTAEKIMKVVYVIDVEGTESSDIDEPTKIISADIAARKTARADILKSCQFAKAQLEQVLFEKLDFGETAVLDLFYNADVVIVDLSVSVQRSPLFYHLGVRESMGMKYNIILLHDTEPELTLSLRLSCNNGSTFLPYKLDGDGVCVVTDSCPPGLRAVPEAGSAEGGPTLHAKLRKALKEVDQDSSAHVKERFLNDLRKARENLKGDDLGKALKALRHRLDDPQLLAFDVILNILISYREIQDYNAMVTLVEELAKIPNNKVADLVTIQHLYAFALNRRNNGGDRDKALAVILRAIDQCETPVPDMICLCGRIYKDKFVESEFQDKESLENAIVKYRQGFDVQPNEYAGINLATLLVISGKQFSKCPELQRIGLILNNLIGKKGSLTSLKDYWDVATFFEISVLAEDYGKAVQAAECMFKLEPPNWYLKSTIGNITLINGFRVQEEDGGVMGKEKQLFLFWMDFFVEATKTDMSDVRFPVLVLEPTKVFLPSYVQINDHTEDNCVRLWHVISDPEDKFGHEWMFPGATIKGVSKYKRDHRAVFLYVEENSDDFHIFFSSELQATRFCDLVTEMISACKQGIDPSDLDLEPIGGLLEYEYDTDEKGGRVVLGRGTYGTVYAARCLKTQIRVAIKEVPEKNIQEVQPLHEEIKLHSRLSHKNIVKYLGSVSEDGYFKIFMEQVPGGSLSQLLRSKWGPLKGNETTIAYYTKQILEGLKYLHDNKIVHRDIKGDNVLVNTYSGVLKISDFGTCKRLSGINPRALTFAGTIQYMAPEVIDKGFRGYGPAADIWSLGCTVVEMASGKPPFIELGSPEAAMFKVGYYKIHPEIPDCMSEKAKQFILRCFEPDSETRASASLLLEDPFIVESLGSKKKKKDKKPPEPANMFLRSTSVPQGNAQMRPPTNLRLPRKRHMRPTRRISSPEDEADSTQTDGSIPELDSPMVHPKTWHKSTTAVPASASISSAGTGSSHSPVSTAELDDQPPTADSLTGREGGLYLLRKESERRVTLVQILSDDKDDICQRWLQFKNSDCHGITDPKLTLEHLKILLEGLKTFIQDRNKVVISEVLAKLKEELDFDMAAIMELQMALYVFQEAVNVSLKHHSIQPHWMFALDTLLRDTIHTAITILSPDLGPHLAPQPPDDDGNTSGFSTDNSLKSQTMLTQYQDSANKELHTQIQQLRDENQRLLRELLEKEKQYGDLLKYSIQCKNQQMEQIRVLSGMRMPITNSTDPHHIEVSPPPDDALTEWLQNAGVDDDCIAKIINEDYTLCDLHDLVTREDLLRLQLRGGVFCRLWRAILDVRQQKFAHNCDNR
ncbi:mitogen-activated protein kinase kinase kinase 15-like isoform X2 [Liolophura sinensis]|uniref:mitogen-activated protein kinase kinase kinase 15-like isoform X2 n=1 Tax=Liolophura sinensis TaxID=3198878 RepID=UPI0031593C76